MQSTQSSFRRSLSRLRSVVYRPTLAQDQAGQRHHTTVPTTARRLSPFLLPSSLPTVANGRLSHFPIRIVARLEKGPVLGRSRLASLAPGHLARCPPPKSE